MSDVIREAANSLNTMLDSLNEKVKIDKKLFLMLYGKYIDIEESQDIVDYLVHNKDVDMQVIKNTKIVFHEIVWNFIVTYLSRKQELETLKILKDYQYRLEKMAENLVDAAIEQELVMKMPTVEELRKQSA